MRFKTLVIFLVLLIPSAFYIWKNPDMTKFGRLHDDGLLFVSAKSLASGDGFRILSLPEQPAQTKYPILYPLYLSLIWRVNPHFPENLNVATWFCWPVLILSLALAWIYWRGERLDEPRTALVVGVLAISPYMILFGCNMFSEIFFLCWLLGSLIVGKKEGLAAALIAGALAGAAYLSRTAGIALIVSMPAWYLWRHQFRRAIAFAGGMLPFILGWSFWSAAHKFPPINSTLIYYTDYVKFEFLNVDRSNLLVVLWKNLDSLLYAMGSLVIPRVIELHPLKILSQVIAIAMISGIIRLALRGRAIPYAIFALVSSGMLVAWHFPPNERFVLPIFPVLAAGLVVELEHLYQMIRGALRHKDRSQRVVAGVFATAVVLIFGAAISLELYVTFKYMPQDARSDRERWAEMRSTYEWISHNVPASAGILSADDPPLYLATGHPGNFAPLLPRWWYADDHLHTIGFFKHDLIAYCRSRGFDYILSTPDEMNRWSDGQDEPAVQQALRSNPQLQTLYKGQDGTIVYRITHNGEPSMDPRATP